MKITKIDINALVAPEKNVRRHGEKQIQEIIRSIEMFGQFRPLVIDENNVVYAGNGLLQAMKAMGMKQVEVYRIEGLTEAQKKKLMLADNKTYSLGVDDYGVIEEIIKEIGDFEIPGFDEQVLQDLYGEAEEQIAAIENYGVLAGDEIESLKQKEIQMAAAQEQRPVEQKYSYDQSFAARSEATENTYQQPPVEMEKSAEINKFVICPHCKQKIFI